MFCVSEAQAAVIRTAFEQRGELSAVVELRRLFPGLGNIALARECVRTVAGWQPLLVRHAPRKEGLDSPRTLVCMVRRSRGGYLSSAAAAPLRRIVRPPAA